MKLKLPAQKKWKYAPALYIVVCAAWVLYTVLTLAAPVDSSARYNLTDLQLMLVRITVIVPMLAIWLLAARGAIAFKHYASIIRDSPEARGVSMIATGLVWSVAYLVMLILPGAFDAYLMHGRFLNWIIIFSSYAPMVLALIAFTFLYLGSQRLGIVGKFTTWTTRTWILAAAYGVFCGLLANAFYDHHVDRTADVTHRVVTNVVSPGVFVLTLILPYLICWFLGFLASINVSRYARNVSGVIYRQALRDLVKGIVAIVLFAVLVQLVNLFASSLLGLSLGFILLAIYLIVIFYALGFLFIASGAKKLTRIEVVD